MGELAPEDVVTQVLVSGGPGPSAGAAAVAFAAAPGAVVGPAPGAALGGGKGFAAELVRRRGVMAVCPPASASGSDSVAGQQPMEFRRLGSSHRLSSANSNRGAKAR
jgi:hypothetical protein